MREGLRRFVLFLCYWLDFWIVFLKFESIRISIIFDKGFKFLVLEIVKENIYFINSYLLRFILF